jgi:hypothetical protein
MKSKDLTLKPGNNKPHILDNKMSSSCEMLNSGVPQSSNTGHLLFVIYLNYLIRGLHQGA